MRIEKKFSAKALSYGLPRLDMGSAITLDKLINVSGDSRLCFRPFEPPMDAICYFIWKQYPVFTKAASTFLEQFKKDIQELRMKK